MANFLEVMETVWEREHNNDCDKVLHYNAKERDYTFYGIYPMRKLKGSEAIYSDLKSGLSMRSVSRKFCGKDTKLYQEVLAFYYLNFWVPMALDYVESTHKAKEIMVLMVNIGMGRRKRIVREVQRLIGVEPDGVIGAITLNALNNYPDNMFDKEFDNIEEGFYRDLVNRVSRLKWALPGWINRAYLV